MAAGRRPSLRCVECSPRTRNRIVRTSRWRRPPRPTRRETSVPTGPVSRRTTTAIVRVSHSRHNRHSPMCRIIRTGPRLPTTRASGGPMSKTMRTGHKLPTTRVNRRAMRRIIQTGPRLPTMRASGSPACKTIRTGHRPPITPASSHKAISREIRPPTTAGKSPITIVRLPLGQMWQTPLPLRTRSSIRGTSSRWTSSA